MHFTWRSQSTQMSQTISSWHLCTEKLESSWPWHKPAGWFRSLADLLFISSLNFYHDYLATTKWPSAFPLMRYICIISICNLRDIQSKTLRTMVSITRLQQLIQGPWRQAIKEWQRCVNQLLPLNSASPWARCLSATSPKVSDLPLLLNKTDPIAGRSWSDHSSYLLCSYALLHVLGRRSFFTSKTSSPCLWPVNLWNSLPVISEYQPFALCGDDHSCCFVSLWLIYLLPCEFVNSVSTENNSKPPFHPLTRCIIDSQ